MSQEEQRIAIAEACGWMNVRFCGHNLEKPGPYCYGQKQTDAFYAVPDYANDLNAMRSALRILDQQQRVQFMNTLRKIEGCTVSDFDCILSDKWPEAFLRTIGQWKT